MAPKLVTELIKMQKNSNDMDVIGSKKAQKIRCFDLQVLFLQILPEIRKVCKRVKYFQMYDWFKTEIRLKIDSKLVS